MARIVHSDERAFHVGLVVSFLSAAVVGSVVFLTIRPQADSPFRVPMPDLLRIALGILVILSGLILLASPILLPILYWAARKGRREVQFLMQPEGAWVHWQYSEEEWAEFTEAEWQAAQPRALRLSLYAFGIFVLVLLVGPYISRTRPTGVRPLSFVVSFGAIFGIIAGAALYWREAAYHNYRRQHRGDVYVGPEAVIHDGRYTRIHGNGISTVASLSAGIPPTLCFKETWLGGYRVPLFRIPIPQGKEREAVALVRRFGGEVDPGIQEQALKDDDAQRRPAGPQRSAIQDDQKHQAPWTPTTIGVLSAFLGPLAGGVLVYKNLTRLGRPEKAFSVLLTSLLASVLVVWMGQGGIIVILAAACVFPALCHREFKAWTAENPGSQASLWLAMGWGLVGFLLYAVLVFAVVTLHLYPPGILEVPFKR